MVLAVSQSSLLWDYQQRARFSFISRQFVEAVLLYVRMEVFPQGKVQGTGQSESINRSLTSYDMNRFVLADTAQLHAKIAEMGQRIRQLEDAIAIFQSGISNECHPLLRDELLAIKFGPEKGHVSEKEYPTRDNSIDSIDALGTLTIGDRGEAKYFGRSAGSEVRISLHSVNPYSFIFRHCS